MVRCYKCLSVYRVWDLERFSCSYYHILRVRAIPSLESTDSMIQLWQHLFYIYKYSASCRYLQHRCTKELGEKVILYQQEAAYLISQSHIALLTSMGPKIQLSKWLFVIAWKETTLQSLMENWSVVRYQKPIGPLSLFLVSVTVSLLLFKLTILMEGRC